MKDFLGRELAIGDWVITFQKHYKNFCLGQITGFTAKMVRVDFNEQTSWSSRTAPVPASSLLKISNEDMLLYRLGK
jgi:hypothetical protein